MKTLTLLMALAAAPAFAQDYTVGDLTIVRTVSYPSVGMAGAGYMEITNTGAMPDRLTAAEADFPRVEIHESSMGDDGVMRMEQQAFVAIAPGETVAFKPGGLHVMFMGLSAPLEIGTEIPATLTFEAAGTVDVVFTVEERPTEGGTMNHDAMGDDAMDDE